MNEAIIDIGLGLLLVGILFLIIWDTSHAVRTATIGGGIGGA